MALITCPECGRQISEYAPSCPGCGVPMEIIKKLLSDSEPMPAVSDSEDEAEIKGHAELHRDIAIKSGRIRCVICANEYDLSIFCCPVCKYPALSLAFDPEEKMQNILKSRDELGFGDAESLFKLGKRYQEGDGVEKDYVAAAKWYNLAAERGYEDAVDALIDLFVKTYNPSLPGISGELTSAKVQYEIGERFYSGRRFGIPKNYKAAFEWFQKAADQGNKNAKDAIEKFKETSVAVNQDNDDVDYYNLGRQYYSRQDYTKAAECYQKAAGQGNSSAQFLLGILYQHGRGVQQDMRKSSQWYHKAAEQGVPEAQYNLGKAYFDGRGVEKDYRKAFEWILKAAEQGDIKGQQGIGYLYESGQGIQQDFRKAIEWYQKAADQGNRNAKDAIERLKETSVAVNQDNDDVDYNLGQQYYSRQDYTKALEWYLKSANQGNSDAENKLGYMYSRGLGTDKDYKKAFEWYQKAANHGNSSAENSLGHMYQCGTGVDKNYKKAIEWYKRAVSKGNSSAAYNLGYMYKKGLGVIPNKRTADKWYQKSRDLKNMNVKK